MTMATTPNTRASLIARLSDSHDAEAWQEFVEIYLPLLYRLARRKGVSAFETGIRRKTASALSRTNAEGPRGIVADRHEQQGRVARHGPRIKAAESAEKSRSRARCVAPLAHGRHFAH